MNAATRLLIATLLTLALACSDDASEATAPPDAGEAAVEASADATPDVLPELDGCAADNGSLACGKMIETMCARYVQCCATAACPAWAESVTTCKAEYVATIDCTDPNYANASVCSEEVQTCQEDVPLVACSDLTSGTANWPQTCKDLWSQMGAP